jgi:hypothetical protein
LNGHLEVEEWVWDQAPWNEGEEEAEEEEEDSEQDSDYDA